MALSAHATSSYQVLWSFSFIVLITTQFFFNFRNSRVLFTWHVPVIKLLHSLTQWNNHWKLDKKALKNRNITLNELICRLQVQITTLSYSRWTDRFHFQPKCYEVSCSRCKWKAKQYTQWSNADQFVYSALDKRANNSNKHIESLQSVRTPFWVDANIWFICCSEANIEFHWPGHVITFRNSRHSQLWSYKKTTQSNNQNYFRMQTQDTGII